MADNGVKVQRFFVVDTANEALEAAKKLSKLTLPVECVAPSVNAQAAVSRQLPRCAVGYTQ